jgi:hypothetical protein
MIPRRDAERMNIADSEHVTIRKTECGIMTEKETAAGGQTSSRSGLYTDSELETGANNEDTLTQN